jgi:pimeloyl-ACP methyl ester carboxylesterase
MSGTDTFGYYWFLGPYERPELTTFGDSLYHLETLLIDLVSARGNDACFLVGRGEGGVMALTIATIWPELLSGVISIDGPLPENIESLPIDLAYASKLRTLVFEGERSMRTTERLMSNLGADVELCMSNDKPIETAVSWLHSHISRGISD